MVSPRWIVLASLFCAFAAAAQTQPNATKITNNDGSKVVGVTVVGTSTALNVNVIGGSGGGGGVVTQGTIPWVVTSTVVSVTGTVAISNGGSGGTSATFGAAFPALGTAVGVISPTGSMTFLKVAADGSVYTTSTGGGSTVTQGTVPWVVSSTGPDVTTPLSAATSGVLAATGSVLVLNVTGYVGASVVAGGTLRGQINVQTSFDPSCTTGTFFDEPAAGPFYVYASSTIAATSTVSFPLPAGAMCVQARVNSMQSGTSTVALRATQNATVSRATVDGLLGGINDYIAMPIDPSRWASVRFIQYLTTTSTPTRPEYSIDGGLDWLSVGPYVVRLDAPATSPVYSGVFTSAGGSAAVFPWLYAVPGNATHVRVFGYSAFGASGSIRFSIVCDKPLLPGQPVVATIYDVTSAANTPLSPGIIEVGGWTSLRYLYNTTSSAGVFTLYSADNGSGGAGPIITTSSVSSTGGFGPGTAIGGLAGLAHPLSSLQMPTRIQPTTAAISGATTRLLLEVRR